MTDTDPDSYHDRASSWAIDMHASLVGSVRRARIAAVAIGVIAVLEAFALVLLTPLKTVTMVPVLVDRHTGFVERLDADGAQELKPNDALIQSLLAQYVAARESFDINTVAADYHKVALWSSGAAKRDYLALMPASNPQSPLRRYPRATFVQTLIKSISPLGNHTALVRFETERRDQDGEPIDQEWAAVLVYHLSTQDLSASDRWLNPLGFQVVSYHRDAEAPVAAPSPGPQPIDTASPLSGQRLAAAPLSAPSPSASGQLTPGPYRQ